MTKPLQVGIIGFGLSGKVFHAPFIHCHPNFNLKKIISKRKSEISAIYPYVEIGTVADELFSDKEIDLIIVATPNTCHFEYTKEALESGKHVILEKPITNSSAEADELISISKQSNKVLSIFHNRRWDGDFKTIRDIINKDQLGRVVEFESHFDRYRPEFDSDQWRLRDEPGSGVLFDLGPHLIDQAVCLFGKPWGVWADIRNQRNKGTVDDTFEVQLMYKEVKVILKAGVLVRELGPRFIMHGTHGSFVKYGLDPQEGELAEGKMPDSENWGKDKKENFGILNTVVDGKPFRGSIETMNGNYSDYFQNVYDAINGNEDLIVKPEDARLAIEIIEAAFRSHSGKKIIELE